MPKAASPFHGEVTAGFRGYPGHNGFDIRPAKRYSYGNPVAAMLPGKVVDLVRHQKKGSKTNGIGRSYDYGFMTGNGVIIENADGEHQVANHCMPVSTLKIGDTVKAGDIIAYNDDSGNQTGAHIHLEYRRYDKVKKCYMPYDFRYLFNLYKITPGAPLEKVSEIKPAASKPLKPKLPVAKPKPKPKKYIPVKLGDRNATVGKVQAALRKKGYTKQTVDNYFGEDQTEFNVKHFQRNNGLKPDGIAGKLTQRKLGL